MQVINHEYSSVNENKDAVDIDYVSIDIPWGEIRNYEIISKIGRGKYSLVFEAIDIRNKQKVVIKALRPIRKEKILREYFMLKNLKHPNLVKLKDSVRDPLTKTASFILQQVQYEEHKTLYPKFSYQDIKFYMKQLFKTLDFIHSNGVMHRDIKPQNILIDHVHKSLKVIDFSLADLYYPEKQYSTRVSSLYYKAPQLLLGNVFYDYRVDIWSAGIILAGLIFKTIPFLQGLDELDQLEKVASIVGTKQIASYCKQNADKLLERKEMRKSIIENYAQIKELPRSNFKNFVNKTNQQFATEDVLNLISKLLQLNPKVRLTAKQALQHPFFAN